MRDSGLINEKPRVTLIQRLDGSVFLLGPKGKTIEFEIGTPLQEIRAKVAEFGWVVGVEHLQRKKIEDLQGQEKFGPKLVVRTEWEHRNGLLQGSYRR
jgi:hypothetical protein